MIKSVSASGAGSVDESIDQCKHPPTATEIINTISKLKNKKASSDIPAEFVKAVVDFPQYISVYTVYILTNMYSDVWNNIVLANDWRQQIVTHYILTTAYDFCRRALLFQSIHNRIN